MKKLFAVGATAALMLGATSPALALDVDVDVVGDENVVTTETEGSDVRYNAIAQNLIGSIGDIDQSQYGVAEAVAGDATAVSDDESVAVANSEAAAEVAQEQDFTFVQFNSALNDF